MSRPRRHPGGFPELVGLILCKFLPKRDMDLARVLVDDLGASPLILTPFLVVLEAKKFAVVIPKTHLLFRGI